MTMDYRKWIGLSAASAGLIVAIVNYAQGDVALATIIFLVLSLLPGFLFWWTRRSGGGLHISHAAAQKAVSNTDVIIYWRPGCIHCDRLKLGLGRARHAVSWVDISRDAAGAAFVAAHHNGNKTVPTVITGRGELIAATPEAIKARLRTNR